MAEMQQVFVIGMEAGVHTIAIATNDEDFRQTTISRFRSLVHEKWDHVATGASELRLLFAGKQLQEECRPVWINADSAWAGEIPRELP